MLKDAKKTLDTFSIIVVPDDDVCNHPIAMDFMLVDYMKASTLCVAWVVECNALNLC